MGILNLTLRTQPAAIGSSEYARLSRLDRLKCNRRHANRMSLFCLPLHAHTEEIEIHAQRQTSQATGQRKLKIIQLDETNVDEWYKSGALQTQIVEEHHDLRYKIARTRNTAADTQKKH